MTDYAALQKAFERGKSQRRAPLHPHGEAANQGAAACYDKGSLTASWWLRRAGSSPQVVLLTDIVTEDQKTPERSSSPEEEEPL